MVSQVCVSGSGVINDLVTNENDLVGQERDGLVGNYGLVKRMRCIDWLQAGIGAVI